MGEKKCNLPGASNGQEQSRWGRMVRNEHLSEQTLQWNNSHGTHDYKNWKEYIQANGQDERSVAGKSRIVSEYPHQKPPNE